jgi:hypothetical protein
MTAARWLADLWSDYPRAIRNILTLTVIESPDEG